MSWLKMTSEALFLMKGGTNEFLDKVDLVVHESDKKEFKLDIPKQWLKNNDAPRTIIIDIGSKEVIQKANSGFIASTGIVPDKVLNKKNILTRKDWNAKEPTSRFETVDRPRFIVIHHTDTSSMSKDRRAAAQLARSIQDFHMQTNGWSDIGYNFLNTIGGILIEGRSGSLEQAIKGNSVRGAHAGTDDGNRSPGVSNEGNFSINKMDDTQWNSLVDICVALCLSCDIDPSKIMGHRDFVATDCPGNNLYKRLPELRKAVAKKLTD
jgi:hypothetical protein